MVTIIFNSVNTVKPQLSPLWFLVRVFSFHPCRERKITSVQNSMRTGGKREEVGWGFTEEHVHSRSPSADGGNVTPTAGNPRSDPALLLCCQGRGEGLSVDWTRGGGRGEQEVSLGRKKGEQAGC